MIIGTNGREIAAPREKSIDDELTMTEPSIDQVAYLSMTIRQ